jgi:hypothetical protein
MMSSILQIKLCELLDDPERRARMGLLGRHRVEGGSTWHHQVPRPLRPMKRLCRVEMRARILPTTPKIE